MKMSFKPELTSSGKDTVTTDNLWLAARFLVSTRKLAIAKFRYFTPVSRVSQ